MGKVVPLAAAASDYRPPPCSGRYACWLANAIAEGKMAGMLLVYR
jgi:hypothetical protein